MFTFTKKAKLKKRKEFVLFEVEQDLYYIETFKGESLQLDEGPLRKRMGELKRKEDRTQDEDVEYIALSDEVARSVAVKAEYEKSTELAKELRDYISLL